MKKLLAILLSLCMVLSLSTAAFAAAPDLVIAVDADVDTLHPSDYSTTIEVNILNQIFDTLVYMNPDGSEEPEPRIARHPLPQRHPSHGC